MQRQERQAAARVAARAEVARGAVLGGAREEEEMGAAATEVAATAAVGMEVGKGNG
jgi:hypothetical protein